MPLPSSSPEFSPIPVIEYALPEARARTEIVSNLQRIFDEGMPGFTIHASRLRGEFLITPEWVVNEVAHVLSEMPDSPVRPTGQLLRLRPHRAEKQRSSVLRPSLQLPEGSPELKIFWWESGREKVFLANQGSMPFEDITDELADQADMALRHGSVIESVIKPEVYVGTVKCGDALVTPNVLPPSTKHDKAGPIWQRVESLEVPVHVGMWAIKYASA